MEIIRCENGHYYDPTVCDSCPECALSLAKETGGDFGFDLNNDWRVPHVKCTRGHVFTNIFSDRCPICGAPEKGAAKVRPIWQEQPKRNQPEALTEVTDLRNTLIFGAMGSLSLRLWRDEMNWYLTVRAQLSTPWPVLEHTVAVSADEVNRAGHQILNKLYDTDAHTALMGHEYDVGDTRLLINTRQINCDYRGNSWKLPYPVRQCWDTILVGLGDLLAKYQENRYRHRESRHRESKDDLVAELGYGTTNCALRREGSGYRMDIEDITYYNFTKSFTLRESVPIPRESGQQLLEWLGDCGVMEALIEKNKRPEDDICRDPAVGTIFYLRSDNLVYSYRDWDKENNYNESDALNKALQEMLTCFAYYRDNKTFIPDITIPLP